MITRKYCLTLIRIILSINQLKSMNVSMIADRI